MADWNRWTGEGTLWSPELKTTTEGTSIFRGRISIYDGRDADGNFKYISRSIRAFGSIADNLAKAKERDRLTLEGELKTDKWKDKEGKTRYIDYILVTKFGKDVVEEELGDLFQEDSDLPF